MDEFVRTRLLLGEKKMNVLRGSSVLVFGIGGVGSHCTQALARAGVGSLYLVDHDTVSISNINRQCVAFHSTVGEFKTQVMKKQIFDICPETEVKTFETFILPENLDVFFSELPSIPDYIVDAIDTVSAKLSIISYAAEKHIPVISSMGTGNKLHPEMFKIADISDTSVCPLCRIMRHELKKRNIEHVKVLYSSENPLKPLSDGEKDSCNHQGRPVPGSISFVPPAAGLIIAGEVVRNLISSGENFC